MTQEDKDLLLKDICARLPYEVKVCCNNTVYNIDAYTKSAFMLAEPLKPDVCLVAHIEGIKPYLFRMPSMTDEQKEELQKLRWNFDGDDISNSESYYSEHTDYVTHFECYSLIDWLNKNHFDYRGLIPMGLAIDATGLNIY